VEKFDQKKREHFFHHGRKNTESGFKNGAKRDIDIGLIACLMGKKKDRVLVGVVGGEVGTRVSASSNCRENGKGHEICCPTALVAFAVGEKGKGEKRRRFSVIRLAYSYGKGTFHCANTTGNKRPKQLTQGGKNAMKKKVKLVGQKKQSDLLTINIQADMWTNAVLGSSLEHPAKTVQQEKRSGTITTCSHKQSDHVSC